MEVPDDIPPLIGNRYHRRIPGVVGTQAPRNHSFVVERGYILNLIVRAEITQPGPQRLRSWQL